MRSTKNAERGTRNSEQKDEASRSEEHTSELQSRLHLVCRLLLEKKKKKCDGTYRDRDICSAGHRSARPMAMSARSARTRGPRKAARQLRPAVDAHVR